ncbi:hypothetical protein B0H17DRAFT_1135130 [Mycena rosella]|uniref:Uncharacterized protein n=1 Tax=Mycena rosella TaxID=1033263 RepID=A0AAD7DDU3_MYCRO|nr:hypothetical protein B0H17DRAFT_1135130 [Mycena rosella]
MVERFGLWLNLLRGLNIEEKREAERMEMSANGEKTNVVEPLFRAPGGSKSAASVKISLDGDAVKTAVKHCVLEFLRVPQHTLAAWQTTARLLHYSEHINCCSEASTVDRAECVSEQGR